MSGTFASKKGWKEDQDKKWEQVQIKAFKSWMNGYFEKKGIPKVEDVTTDLCDGTRLIVFLESVTGKSLGRYDKTPQIEIQRIQNVNTALNFVQKDLGVRLVGIGAEDIVHGHQKLILGLLWSMFRKLRLETIAQDGKSGEDGLLAWIRQMTEGYEGVDIKNFRESFNDGLAFSALVNKFNNELLDYDEVPRDNADDALTRAFEIAEKEMGIPQLLDKEDLLSGKPDERSVTVYASLFFHAFSSDEARKRMEEQAQKVTNKVTDLQNELAESLTLNEELKNAKLELESRLSEMEELLASKDQLLGSVVDEIEFLDEVAVRDAEGLTCLSEKVAMYSSTVNPDENDTSAQDAINTAKAKLQSNTDRLDKLRSKKAEGASNEDILRSLLTAQEERDRLLKELADWKAKMQAEIDRLKKQLELERQARSQQSKELLELRSEIDRLKSRAIIEGKARFGLEALRRNLEEHLEDLYKWRDLHELTIEEAKPFDKNEVLGQLKDKSFEDQVQVLDDRLREENQNLLRIVKLKDSTFQLKEIETKSGWLTMKGRKDWKKRWFSLRGLSLLYFEDENSERYEGIIDLNKGCEVVRQKAVKDEESTRKLWPLKITVGERKLFVRAATKKERHSWFLHLASKIAHVNYIKQLEESGARPDTRLLSLFNCTDVPALYVDGRPIQDEGASALARTLPAHDETEVLSINDAGLGDSGCKLIAEVLEKLSVKTLSLSGNGIGAAGAKALAAGIPSNLSLVELNLSNNQIDDEGFSALAEAFSGHAKLCNINMANNNLGAAGVTKFASLFSTEEKRLPVLNLSNNKLDDEAASQVAALLKANPTITSVNLSGNQIGDAGAKAIAAALSENATVATLDLSNNNIGPEGAKAVQSVLASNIDLHRIDISNNKALVGSPEASDILNTKGFRFPALTLERI